MHMFQAVARQPLGVLIGFVSASALFLLVFGLAFASGRVLASHDASGNVHACVNRYTGQARIMLPGRPPSCTAGEVLVELGSGAAAADVEARLSALETQVPDCLSTEGVDAVFEGCNVHVRDGSGDTDGATNGSGNLIVGYNENDEEFARSGSHNLVVGANHGYSSYGGFVAGVDNQITGIYSSVSGGQLNTASGVASSVSGGFGNTASDQAASVSGGSSNTASGLVSSVSGGRLNTASGDYASVSGGSIGTAADTDDWVAGSLFENN